MSMTLKFNGSWGASPLGRFKWAAAAAAFADVAGPVVRSALKKEAPVASGPNAVRPGRMRDAIRYSRSSTAGDALRLEYTASPPYTPFVIDGTKPHDIQAVAAQSLHWIGPGGADVFRRAVHHPGTAANRFPRRAMEASKAEVAELFKQTMTDALGGS